MEILWSQHEPYRHIGVVDNYRYVIRIEQIWWPRKNATWSYTIHQDEDTIYLDDIDEDHYDIATLVEAKERAVKTLQAYISEQDSFTNCLKEVMK